jgi:hypothetical protein
VAPSLSVLESPVKAPSAAGDMHREGGGPDQDVIVFFDMRGRDGVFYEILDDDQNVIASLGYGEFLGAYRAQEGIA